jgi:hypothetical protein
MPPPQKTTAQPTPWSLEVVRGRDVGLVYDLRVAETILGNSLNGEQGLDLREQEGNSPRRMAARQASMVVTGQELAIRDLDSPGGTFVNRQRLLPGQSRRLQAGDVIQLGSVQLRVAGRGAAPTPATPERATPPPLPPPSTPVAPVTSAKAPPAGVSTSAAGRLPAPFVMAGGSSCRTWDDFLVLAAQHWKDLREELASGRLAGYLRQIQRDDLIPGPEKVRSLDDQLDQWLARIPTTYAKDPELDVHPDSLNVRAMAGGGVVRQVVRITNVGYRLLKCTARIEPSGTSWIRLCPEHDGRPFDTIEQTDLHIELVIPELLDRPLAAAVVLDGNGGTRRIGVRIERPAEPPPLPESVAGPAVSPLPIWGRSLSRSIARLGPGRRIVAGIVGAMALRSFSVVASLATGGRGASIVEARLPALAVAFAVLGGIVGGILARPRGEAGWRDTLTSAFAGGLFGLLIAAVVYALIRSVEMPLGGWSSSLLAVELLWAGLGGALAGLSCLVIPHRPDPVEAAR